MDGWIHGYPFTQRTETHTRTILVSRRILLFLRSPSGEGIAIGMLAGAGIAVSFFFWVALSRYAKSRTVRLGYPALCKTFIVSFCSFRRRRRCCRWWGWGWGWGRGAFSLSMRNQE